ncbi:hypothetical protein D3C81_1431280 [compost metagenome]
MAGGQGAGEVARENQLEAIAAGVGIVVLDVGAVVAGAVADLQGATTAITQAGEAQAGQVDLVLGDVEVGHSVIEACGCIAVAVGLRGETERIGAGTTGEFVDARTAHQNVATGPAIDRIVAGPAVENLAFGAARQGVVASRTLHSGHRHRVADVAAVTIDQRGTLAGVTDGIADDGIAIRAVFIALCNTVGREVAAADDVALDGVVAAVEVLA